jgi:hypothetical protein
MQSAAGLTHFLAAAHITSGALLTASRIARG